MQAASITPSSYLIGDTGTTMTISLTPKTTLKSTGTVTVYFPPWNP